MYSRFYVQSWIIIWLNKIRNDIIISCPTLLKEICLCHVWQGSETLMFLSPMSIVKNSLFMSVLIYMKFRTMRKPSTPSKKRIWFSKTTSCFKTADTQTQISSRRFWSFRSAWWKHLINITLIEWTWILIQPEQTQA